LEENQKNYVDRLGVEYGTLFYHCYQDICHLRLTWKSYQSLFGSNQERLDLLYSVSNVFSYVMKKALHDSTLLGIRRLTEPYVTTKKKRVLKSISIQGFRGLFDERPDKDHFDKILQDALSSVEVVAPYINKKIAHADLDVKEGVLTVSDFSRQQISKAIEDIAHVIKWVALQTMRSSVSTIPALPAADELWFLKHVYEGVLAMNRKEAQSMEYTASREYQKRERLYTYPDWLMNTEKPTHDLLD